MPINSFLYPGAKFIPGYEVANSCRFEEGRTTSLSRTLGTPTTANVWTFSCWVKKSKLGDYQVLLAADVSGSGHRDCIRFQNDDKLSVFFNELADGEVKTNRAFRDPSAWLNIVVAVDTTQATDTNRVKIYVNGTQETSLATSSYPAEDYTCGMNTNDVHRIGRDFLYTEYFDGYLAEVCFIDGQQLTPTSFGEFDEDSPTIWKPIDVSGLTFGDNGAYLDFEDSDNLGDDESGNANDWAENNIAATDQATDTPTNNFCTWNSIADNLDVTLSEGNTKVVHGTALARRPVISTFGVSAGKWYWEWVAEGSPTAANMEVGIVNYASPFSQGRYLGQSLQGDADFTTYQGDGYINMSGSSSDSGTAYAGGDVVGVAVDMDNTLIYFYKNNTLVNSGGTNFSGMEDGSGFIFMSNGDRSGSATYTAGVNFGGSSGFTISSAASDANGYGNFEFAPPSGFLSLCTKNLGSDGG